MKNILIHLGMVIIFASIGVVAESLELSRAFSAAIFFIYGFVWHMVKYSK